jgi:hypothetical protein
VSEGTRRGLEKRAELEARNAELERLLYSTSAADIVALRAVGALPEKAHPLADFAAASVRRLHLAAEGEPESPHYRPLSEQRSALLDTAERVLLLGMLEMVRGLEGDSESSARAGTLLGKFATLVKDCVGLNAPEHQVPDLTTYLAQKAAENRSSDEISNDPDALPATASPDASSGDDGGDTREHAPGSNRLGVAPNLSPEFPRMVLAGSDGKQNEPERKDCECCCEN